ncbi:MAG: DNA alkylation repair protein [Muribaculaceae bacterium]|nr:DNA alkylation repair protein [Muribaculaceae bacterium]MDE6321724.1 DNA alkylation repair protein [Muribaculaceae bacterium]
MEKETTQFNDMQRIKRRFFAMRNGALADQLRRAGAPYRIIFGLNLPQLTEIAADTPQSASLAERLWANRTTRESLLLAPMLYPMGAMQPATAMRWALTADTPEVVDVLCHKLLRRLDFCFDIADELWQAPAPINRYAALRLMLNRFPQQIDSLVERARQEAERHDTLTASLCRQIIDEAEFFME